MAQALVAVSLLVTLSVATASTGNVDYVKGLGADDVIDYNAQDFTEAVSGCDAVFETVGGDVATRCCRRATVEEGPR